MWTSRTSSAEASPSTSSAPIVTVIPPEPQQQTEHNASSGSSSRPSSGRSRHRRGHHHQHHGRQHQHQPGQHRYHFNQLEAGMPLNFWGIDRRDVWRTCFCFHVRTVTIFIGVCHLMLYILYLSYLAAIFMYDVGNDGLTRPRQDQMLPTPVSVSNNNNGIFDGNSPKSDSLTVDQADNPRARLDPLNLVLDTRKANSQIVLLTICNMLITLLMVYGAVRGKPSYLMPFFVLRVFDFCIFCLTMVGYFSYLPNVTETISNAHWFPARDALMEMDPQLLSLLALVVIVMLIAAKAYIIGVVWNCYKYLMLRNSVIRTVIAYRHDDPANLMSLQQNLLPDLPDYETAVNDPRYAKKPPIDGSTSASMSQSSVNNNNANCGLTASTISVPPPPYNVAIAAEPLNFNFEVPDAANQAFREEDTPQQNATETVPSASSENVTNFASAPTVEVEENSASAPQTSDPQLAVQVIDVAPANVVESPPTADATPTAPTAPTDN